jgi:hypothetical protein
MRAVRPILLAVPVAFALVWACTGDDPTITLSGASDAATVGDGGNGTDGGTGDGASSPVCSNGKKDDPETDIDCGGGCGKCAPDKACKVDGDCLTGKCAAGYCEFAKLAWLSGPALPLAEPDFDAGLKSNSYGRELMAAVAADGTIRAVGGYAQIDIDGNKGLSPSEHYIDLAAGDTTWSLLSDVIPGRKLSAATVGANGKLYIFGGTNDVGPSPASWTRPARQADAGTWQNALADLMIQRQDFAVAPGPDGNIYAFGGVTGSPATTLTTTIEAFGPPSGPAWGAISLTMTVPRIGLAAVTAQDGRIYLVGGSAAGASKRNVEAFDVAAKTLTPRADMIEPRTHFAAALGGDGRIYAVGGDTLSSGTSSSHVEAYSPSSNTWTKVSDLTTARIGHAAVVASDGRIWVISGAKTFPGAELIGSVEIYGPKIALGGPTVPAGGTVAVSGSNFAPNAPVRIYVDDPKSAPISTGTADVSGGLASVTVKVPTGVTPGNHRIVMIDDFSRYAVSAPIAVLTN